MRASFSRRACSAFGDAVRLLDCEDYERIRRLASGGNWWWGREQRSSAGFSA
jgi:hypothetical protein